MRHTENPTRYVAMLILLIVLAMAALPASATQYQGEVPRAGDGVPGAYVRYVDLEKGDEIDWSFKSDRQVDFEITIPSANVTLTGKSDISSMGGNFHAERSGVYRFAWYNDNQGEDADLDYTIHQVQSMAWVLGLAILVLIAVVVFAFVLWYHRRRSDSLADALEDMVEETGQVPPVTGPRKVTNRAILVGVVAGLVAISVISYLYLPLEEVEATEGSQLVVTVENAGNASLDVQVSVTASDGTTVQATSLHLDVGASGRVLVLASPDMVDQTLTVHVDDGTGGPTVDREWMPILGQGDEMDISLD
jgi:hypothetical protein